MHLTVLTVTSTQKLQNKEVNLMAKHKNCPNCGAVYEIESYKCPYCGTLYYDMSAIDIDNREPFFIKIHANGMEITQLVMVDSCSIGFEYDNVSFYGKYGNEMLEFHRSANASTHLDFEAVNIPGKNCIAEFRPDAKLK